MQKNSAIRWWRKFIWIPRVKSRVPFPYECIFFVYYESQLQNMDQEKPTWNMSSLLPRVCCSILRSHMIGPFVFEGNLNAHTNIFKTLWCRSWMLCYLTVVFYLWMTASKLMGHCKSSVSEQCLSVNYIWQNVSKITLYNSLGYVYVGFGRKIFLMMRNRDT